jgi:hypothetical protein
MVQINIIGFFLDTLISLSCQRDKLSLFGCSGPGMKQAFCTDIRYQDIHASTTVVKDQFL